MLKKRGRVPMNSWVGTGLTRSERHATFYRVHPMTFHFDIQKTLAAVGYVLELHKVPIGHLNLIKILYAADRRALVDWGRPITGDALVAKPNGPALKNLVSMTAGDAPPETQERWNAHFSNKEGMHGGDGKYWIFLQKSPDTGCLSDKEKELIARFHKEYGRLSYYQLMKRVHDKNEFPEWKNPRSKGTYAIDIDGILKRAWKTNDEIQAIHEVNERSASLHKLLNG